MKIHLRADNANGVHTTFTVFVNGANAGKLTMRDTEAASFHQIVASGCSNRVDTFLSTGEWGAREAECELQGCTSTGRDKISSGRFQVWDGDMPTMNRPGEMCSRCVEFAKQAGMTPKRVPLGAV